jgi:hypothetical protein
MTTTAKRSLDTKFEGNFFGLGFTTAGGVDDGGNSDHPTTLMLYAEQMQDVVVEHHSYVTMKWIGQQEFNEFHKALRQLAAELDATYGVPS